MFICNKCHLTYATKRNLLRHNITKHSLLKMHFDCPECNRSFSRKDILQRHSLIHLPNSPTFTVYLDTRIPISVGVNGATQWECAYCSKKFSQKSNLVSHITIVHRITNPCLFVCSYCSKAFRWKRSLKDHIVVLHRRQFNATCENDIESNDIYICSLCSRPFNRKSSLRRHIRRHNLLQKKECRMNCLKCPSVFRYTKELNEHYATDHGIVMSYENLEFENVDNYEQWLEREQHKTVTQFIVWYRKKSVSHSIERRICHRSRYFFTKLNENARKRCLKKEGYKRLGGICPADMQVQIRDDGTCSVLYQKTHVGHNIGDKSELRLIHLNSTEKDRIAAKIASGIPVSEIVNQERRLGFSNGKISRLGLLNREDVRNIAISCGLNAESRIFPGQDPTDVDIKITPHDDDVPFYQGQTYEDSPCKKFQKNDAAVVRRTRNHERYLHIYKGHRMAYEQFKKDALSGVMSIDGDTFLVQSFEHASIVYTVSNNEFKECEFPNEPCRMICDLCNLCVHIFKCSCEESSGKTDMCKHIHLVGIYVQQQQELQIEKLHRINNPANVVSIIKQLSSEVKTENLADCDVADLVNDVIKLSNDDIIKKDVDDNDETHYKVIDDAIANLINLKSSDNPALINYVCKKFLQPMDHVISSFVRS